MDKKRVLLSPIDPVHDIGLKMIRRVLLEAGHTPFLLPPDFSPSEVVEEALRKEVDVILLSRTLGYGVAELLGQFVDLLEETGLRDKVRIAVGGMAIKPSIAAELGFDQGFGPQSTPEEALAFVEGRDFQKTREDKEKVKGDLIGNRTYAYGDPQVKSLLDSIVDPVLAWRQKGTSDGIRRAHLRLAMLEAKSETMQNEAFQEYLSLCDETIQSFYNRGHLPPGVRRLSQAEQDSFARFVERSRPETVATLQRHQGHPLIFSQYGTGCPFMDVAHIKGVESWGADGVVHFDPAWGARAEGFLSGFLTHQESGSVLTLENLQRVHGALEPSTLWQVRAHRGLNTPETAVLAGYLGADLTKINPVYGSLGGGTDPERLLMDALETMVLAARYNMPFDMPTNEELSGVPAFKAFAGMLIVTHLGLRLGAKPVLQPLFCYSPEMMLEGYMKDNYMDYNAAKIYALRKIIDAPIWPGAPIGFITHTEERVQSATTTSLHAGLAASLGVEGISIATTDEAYSRGPITLASRIDTLQGVGETFRFMGGAAFTPTRAAEEYAGVLEERIYEVLHEVARRGSLVDSLYEGLLGNQEDGANPGRAGRGTVESTV